MACNAAAQTVNKYSQISGSVVQGNMIGDDELDGGIQLVHTPGHTEGHICMWHPETKTIFTGDHLGYANSVQRPSIFPRCAAPRAQGRALLQLCAQPRPIGVDFNHAACAVCPTSAAAHVQAAQRVVARSTCTMCHSPQNLWCATFPCEQPSLDAALLSQVHICRYNKDSKAQQVESVKKLLKFDFEHVLPGHGRRFHVSGKQEREQMVAETAEVELQLAGAA